MSDLVMPKDEYGDNGEGEHKNQGDAEKNDKHLPINGFFLSANKWYCVASFLISIRINFFNV